MSYKEHPSESSDTIPYRPAKGVFIGLMLFTVSIFLFAIGILWWIPTVGLGNIHPSLPYILGFISSAIVVVLVIGTVILTITILKGKDVLYSYRLRGVMIKVFFPLMVMVGAVLKIPRIRIEQSFVEINNQLIRSQKGRIRPEKVLLLMPHCIQSTKCKIKVTMDIDNCAMCGKCEIKDLIELSREFGLKIFLAGGGTMARRILREKKPDAIVAAACERDLTSGIQDAYPIPVIGIVNKRPQGYCMGTGVDISKIREALLDFMGGPL
ncbi:MAG: DUF116 domain-containing protein [Thermodesulfobacteriota bacterium]